MTVETALGESLPPNTTPATPSNSAIASLKTAVDVGSMPAWTEERAHVQQLIKDICASYDPIKDGMVVNAVTGHQEDATEQIARIVALLDAPQFQSSPPFTLQRMAELLTEPFKFYPQNHLAKYLRALERVMLVSSSIDDYGQVSVDIHDVPTVEDGEKIKPDTGIVLTPIPWISEADLKSGPTEEETEADEKETKEGEGQEGQDGQDGVQDVSVEMADAPVETADVSVEMTDADLSVEMTHDVPNEVAEELRQEKEDEVKADLLETVTAKEEEKNESEETKNEADTTKTEPAEVEKVKTEDEVKDEKEAEKEEKPETSEASEKEADKASESQETNGVSAESESESDREAKRLKTE